MYTWIFYTNDCYIIWIIQWRNWSETAWERTTQEVHVVHVFYHGLPSCIYITCVIYYSTYIIYHNFYKHCFSLVWHSILFKRFEFPFVNWFQSSCLFFKDMCLHSFESIWKYYLLFQASLYLNGHLLSTPNVQGHWFTKNKPRDVTMPHFNSPFISYSPASQVRVFRFLNKRPFSQSKIGFILPPFLLLFSDLSPVNWAPWWFTLHTRDHTHAE